MIKSFSLLCGVAAILGTAAPAAANIVVNGGFETGDFTGWTLFGGGGYKEVVSGEGEGGPGGGCGEVCAAAAGDFIYDGTYVARFGPQYDVGGIYQTLNTTAGVAYTLTFALKNAGGTPSFFGVSFNGADLAAEIDGDGTLGYETRTYTLIATGSTAELRFSFRQDPEYFYLDDVAVEGGAPADVPEPAMLGLFGMGALALGLARRRA